MPRFVLVLGLVILCVAVAALAQRRSAITPTANKPAAATPIDADVGPRAASQTSSAAAATGPAVTYRTSTASNADEVAIRAVIEAAAKAYNAHDAKTLAALFTPNAEIVDLQGRDFQGSEAIEGVFSGTFAAHPKSRMEIAVASIRFVTPAVAVEEGLSTVITAPGEAGDATRYWVTHVKNNGKWQMASVRDLQENDATAQAELEQLGWLVGNWVDESPQALVKTRYRWTDNQRFLLGEFTVQIHGRPAMTGTQRIGWDPLIRKLRSWVFDSEGGFAEGLWTNHKNEWLVNLTGVTRDGKVSSATNVFKQLGSDRYSFQSRDRVIGGELAPNVAEVVVVREPPKPGQSK